MNTDEIKEQILKLTREYTIAKHKAYFPVTNSIQPNDPHTIDLGSVPYAGRVFDENEVVAAVNSTLDFWLTLGKNGDEFEKKLSKFLGIRSTVLTNS